MKASGLMKMLLLLLPAVSFAGPREDAPRAEDERVSRGARELGEAAIVGGGHVLDRADPAAGVGDPARARRRFEASEKIPADIGGLQSAR